MAGWRRQVAAKPSTGVPVADKGRQRGDGRAGGGRRRERTGCRGRGAERTDVGARWMGRDGGARGDGQRRPWGGSPRRNPKGPSRTTRELVRGPPRWTGARDDGAKETNPGGAGGGGG